jgi:hypothetical protein
VEGLIVVAMRRVSGREVSGRDVSDVERAGTGAGGRDDETFVVNIPGKRLGKRCGAGRDAGGVVGDGALPARVTGIGLPHVRQNFA